MYTITFYAEFKNSNLIKSFIESKNQVSYTLPPNIYLTPISKVLHKHAWYSEQWEGQGEGQHTSKSINGPYGFAFFQKVRIFEKGLPPKKKNFPEIQKPSNKTSQSKVCKKFYIKKNPFWLIKGSRQQRKETLMMILR